MTGSANIADHQPKHSYFGTCTIILLLLVLAVAVCSVVFPKWQTSIGTMCYSRGWQGPAVFMFRTAAYCGDSDAQYYYGYCCEAGLDGPQNVAQADMWYEKAASNGRAEAQYLMARRDYLEAMGTDDDAVAKRKSLCRWLALAVKQGEPHALALAAVVASHGVAQPSIPAASLEKLASKYGGNIDKIPGSTLNQLRQEEGVWDDNEVFLCGREPAENIGLILGYLEGAAGKVPGGLAEGQLGGMYWNIYAKQKAGKVLGLSDSECQKQALYYLEEACKQQNAAALWDAAFLELSHNSPNPQDVWMYLMGGGSLDTNPAVMVRKACQSRELQPGHAGLLTGIAGLDRATLAELVPGDSVSETISRARLSPDAKEKLHRAATLGHPLALEFLLLRGDVAWLETEAGNADNPGRGAMCAWLGRYYELGANAAQKLKLAHHLGLCKTAPEINAQAADWYRQAADCGDPVGEYKMGLLCRQNHDDAGAVSWFTRAALQDVMPRPQVELGNCYYSGRGISQNLDKAVAWYKSALKFGDAQAQLAMSKCYAEGQGVAQNADLALKFCERAAAQGSPEASFLLAEYCEQGLSKIDTPFNLYKKAAEGNVTAAYAKLAGFYFTGKNGAKIDRKQASYWAQKAANAGEGEGHYWLANCYEVGAVGGKNNLQKIFYHYKMAADSVGYLEALQKVAQMYIAGKGTKADGAEAANYLKKVDSFTSNGTNQDAVVAAQTEARWQLGRLYEEGKLVPQDLSAARTWYEKAAEGKNAEAMIALGDLYYKGAGGEANPSEAIKWYNAALEQNEPRAALKLCKCYAEGKGVEQDVQKAVQFCESAAKQGNPQAAYMLGEFCEQGVAQAGNPYDWYKKAAEGKVPDAYVKMTKYYCEGLGSEGVDYKLGLIWASKAAHAGSGDGHYWLAKCYEQNNPHPDGATKAKIFYSYKKAADSVGYFEAVQKVAAMLLEGRGTAKNGVEALKYLKKIDGFSPENGDTEAIKSAQVAARLQIGRLYDEGKQVPQDYAAAKTWYKKAMDGGNVEAIVAIGDLYYYGRGVSKSFDEAMRLYRQASEQGSGEADRNIGFVYYKGIGVSEDYGEAFRWFSKAAERKHPDGTFQLGTCYEYGRGVEANPERADELYRQSAALGFAPARRAIGAVSRAAHRKLDTCCDNLTRIGRAIEKANKVPTSWDEIDSLVGEKLRCPCGGAYSFNDARNYKVWCVDGHSDAGAARGYPEFSKEKGLRTK